jgi:hypothetical protein
MSPKLFLSIMLLFVLVSFLFVGSVGASSEMWSRTFGGKYEDVAYFVVETSDGGFALVGWRRPSWGEHSDLCLVKTDVYGNMEWNVTFGGIEEETAYSVVETSDGGFAAAGFTKSFGAGLADFCLVKTDSCGNLEWNKTYGGAKKDYANYVIQTSDGGFALTGYTNSFGVDGFDFLMVKTDAYGNMEWYKTYGGSAHEKAIYLVEESDGGYVLAGTYTDAVGQDFWLAKTDSFGNMMWNKSIGLEMYSSVVKTSDGGFALYGGTVENIWSFSYTTWLIKTDAYGNVQWNQTYGNRFQESFSAFSLVETSDGGFAFAGGNRLNKTDAYGNMEWSRTYNGTIRSLDLTSNGGYILAGEIPSEEGGRPDFWLAKTDEYGVISEFPSWLILPLFLMATFVAVIVKKRLSQSVTRYAK